MRWPCWPPASRSPPSRWPAASAARARSSRPSAAPWAPRLASTATRRWRRAPQWAAEPRPAVARACSQALEGLGIGDLAAHGRVIGGEGADLEVLGPLLVAGRDPVLARQAEAELRVVPEV